jgi:hypothetical protein
LLCRVLGASTETGMHGVVLAMRVAFPALQDVDEMMREMYGSTRVLQDVVFAESAQQLQLEALHQPPDPAKLLTHAPAEAPRRVIPQVSATWLATPSVPWPSLCSLV